MRGISASKGMPLLKAFGIIAKNSFWKVCAHFLSLQLSIGYLPLHISADAGYFTVFKLCKTSQVESSYLSLITIDIGHCIYAYWPRVGPLGIAFISIRIFTLLI